MGPDTLALASASVRGEVSRFKWVERKRLESRGPTLLWSAHRSDRLLTQVSGRNLNAGTGCVLYIDLRSSSWMVKSWRRDPRAVHSGVWVVSFGLEVR